MDIADTIKANSEQVNADDLLAGPVTARITSVERGSTEQPVFIHMDAFEGRTYRPAKSMRRVLVSAWGTEASEYVGRLITLYNDPTVKWGGQAVGGVRISALSHIDKPLHVALTVSRGKRAPYVVEPLKDETPKDTSGRDWLTELADTGGDADLIKALGQAAKTANAQPAVLDVIRTAYHDAKEGT